MTYYVKFRNILLIFILSRLTAYELELKDDKFRKFIDVSSVDRLSFGVDFNYKFKVAFYDAEIQQVMFTIGRDGYYLRNNPVTWKTFPKLTNGIQHFWFNWDGESRVRFGADDIELGSSSHGKWPLKYIAFGGHDNNIATFIFPNEATFIRSSANKRLNSTSIKIHPSHSNTGCGKACLQNSNCFAFNIKKFPGGNFDCQLIDEASVNVTLFGQHSSTKWFYYILKE